MLIMSVFLIGGAIVTSFALARMLKSTEAIPSRSPSAPEVSHVDTVRMAVRKFPGLYAAQAPIFDALLMARRQATVTELVPELQPPPTQEVRKEYLLQYPSYRFGLTPFRMRLHIGDEAQIRQAVGEALWATAHEERGHLAFRALEKDPPLTVELLLPPDGAKADEQVRKQTKRLEADRETRFEFLVAPAVTEDILIGVRMSYQVPVLKEVRTRETLTTTGSTDPEKCLESRDVTCEQTTERHSLQWDKVDVELTTVWVTVCIRTLFGMSSGTANTFKVMLSPIATLVVLWMNLRGGVTNTGYLVTMAVIGALGAVVPQALTDTLKPKVGKPEPAVRS